MEELPAAFVARLERRDDRHRLGAALRYITSLKRLRVCGLPRDNLVRVGRVNGTHYYADLISCASPWACPVCAAKIRYQRGEEISRAVVKALEKELKILFITRTIPHRRTDDLATTLGLLAEGRRFVTNQPKVKAARKRAGYVGGIAAKEITYGSNGFNPHSHDLEFFCGLSLASFAELSDVYYHYLDEFYSRHGINGLSLGHGVQVEQVDIGGLALANYITKARKSLDIRLSVAHELSRADLKSGHFGSVTPFELAAGYVETGDAGLLGLWHEYEQATFNKSVLRFTQGLKQELKLYEDMHHDEELVAQDVGGAKAVLFKSNLYRQITRIPALEGKVLTALDTGGFEALTELLQTYNLDEPDSYWEV